MIRKTYNNFDLNECNFDLNNIFEFNQDSYIKNVLVW